MVANLFINDIILSGIEAKNLIDILDISFSSFPLPCIICHSAHPLIPILYNQVLSAISWIQPQAWPHVDHCQLSPDGLQQRLSTSSTCPLLHLHFEPPASALSIVNSISTLQRGWLTSSYNQVLACSGPKDVSRSLWSGVSRESVIFLIKKRWLQVVHITIFSSLFLSDTQIDDWRRNHLDTRGMNVINQFGEAGSYKNLFFLMTSWSRSGNLRPSSSRLPFLHKEDKSLLG